ATDELMDMTPSGMLSTSQAETLIMEARKHWFESEEQEGDTMKASEESLASLEGMTDELLAVLTEKEIATRDDLGELATDELMEILPEKMLTEKKAESMIMEARKHWFADEVTSTSTAHA
ncbi:MAG: helix-hairpin-helix domain-containing protein, partial [Alphaproteobacteria bacterium]|nr:helix-hairpin-helix domain-containing protein [Alphaproteobacteria bacterium]